MVEKNTTEDLQLSINQREIVEISSMRENRVAKMGYYNCKNSENFIATVYKERGEWESIDPIKSIIK